MEARGAGESIKPGVERSGTPGPLRNTKKPAEESVGKKWFDS